MSEKHFVRIEVIDPANPEALRWVRKSRLTHVLKKAYSQSLVLRCAKFVKRHIDQPFDVVEKELDRAFPQCRTSVSTSWWCGTWRKTLEYLGVIDDWTKSRNVHYRSDGGARYYLDRDGVVRRKKWSIWNLWWSLRCSVDRLRTHFDQVPFENLKRKLDEILDRSDEWSNEFHDVDAFAFRLGEIAYDLQTTRPMN